MRNVLDFLRTLEVNNNREWFNAHKKEYLAVQDEFNLFASQLIEGIASFDDSVRGLTYKDCTYRIYRDTRFRADKTPYKTHMGVYICPGGKKSGNAGYYFHIEPTQENYIGGHILSSGLYMPEPFILKSVREDIAYNGGEFSAALGKAEDKGFALDTEDSLKRVPAGYPADSPYAYYLKLKNFHAMMSVDDGFVLAPGLTGRLVDLYRATYDLVRHLNRAVQYAREENSANKS